jgi:hypothetical protein
MSALLASKAVEINVNAEYGYSNRNFERFPRVLVCDDYKSCLLLVYKQSNPIPNRLREYRNHFAMYRSVVEDSLLIVRTETTLVYRDNDAVLMFDHIRISNETEDRMRASIGAWDISFDKNITYSNSSPTNYLDYELLCSGEWWFFDRGIILNGTTKYIPSTECVSILVYYELHPKFSISKNHAAAAAVPVSMSKFSVTPNQNNNDDGSNTDDSNNIIHNNTNNNDKSNNLNFTYTKTPSILESSSSSSSNKTPTAATAATVINGTLPTAILPVINSDVGTIRRNDQVEAPNVKYQAVVPSLFWFVSRTKELERSDIKYFIPRDYKCPFY